MADVTTRGFATTSLQVQPKRDTLVGREFNNRFRVQALIARGGMGKVYRALQMPLNRMVALKVLNPTYTSEQSSDFHRRFFLEAATAARLSHPNTVTIFDYGCSQDDILYIAMEYLDGMNLREALRLQPVFAPARAVAIATQIGHAVAEAHSLGVVHRDLKPANIFLIQHANQPDFVKVLDFGLVKQTHDADQNLTRTGLFLGSPGYMSPEQIRGKEVDKRCDIYTLGALLYEMLTGRPPFVRANSMETLMAHVHDPLPSFREINPAVSVSPALEKLVRKCMAKDPSCRYASMDDMLANLTQVAPHEGRALPTPPPTHRPMEETGWTVVSSTGILSRPPPEATVIYGDGAAAPEPATQLIEPIYLDRLEPTVAFDPAPRPAPVPPVKTQVVRLTQTLRPNRQIMATTLVGSLVAAAVIGAFIFVVGLRPPVLRSLTRPNQKISIVLRSHPAGAAVYAGPSLVCLQTPCELHWRAAEPPFNHNVLLRFVLAGYDEYLTNQMPAGSQLIVEPTLYPRQDLVQPRP